MHNQVHQAQDVAPWIAVFLTSVLPGLDGDALIGAFCGSTLYTLRSVETGVAKKAAYMVLSFVCGYNFAPNVHNIIPSVGTGPSALAISLLVVTGSGVVLEWVRKLDIPALLDRFLPNRKG